jgi:2',3'-cyclic-nucleotide 2'-phosphodiesterase (5'-nucleotidase family)
MPARLLHYSDVENAYDDPERIGRLAGLLQHERTEHAVVAGTGDNTSPGVLALVTHGRQALDFFSAVDPDLETFGNHDFDYGPAATRDLVADSPQTWLTANVSQNGSRFGADVGTRPWTVLERDGGRIGFVGVTDPDTGSITPNAGALDFEDPIGAVREASAEMREEGVDHVVVLSHLGRGDEELAVATDVDVILGGHLHSEVIERIEGTLVSRPGVNGAVVHEVHLDGSLSVTSHETSDAPLDESVAASLRERMADAGLDEVVDTVADPIERTHATAFRGESRIGNFVADAYRWASDADVGLQNSGGIRECDPLAGAVRVADLVSVVPFEEPVTLARVTGEELLSVFRQGSGVNLGFGEPHWWHAHLSGAAVVWNNGDRELERARVGGEPVDPDATYTIATTDYLFYTDHEFPVLNDEHRVERLDTQYEVLADYARTVGIDPEIEGRIEHDGFD